MKYYAEILHPTEKKVLWHYFLEAPSKKEAEEFVSKRFIEEQTNGILIDTYGMFIVTVEEDK